MRILFTGASSFTGSWFIEQLAAAGHTVIGCFRTSAESYTSEPRHSRVLRAIRSCEPVWGCTFGDDRFLETIRTRGPWDLFCHHAAKTASYRDPAFDVLGAVGANTYRLDPVLGALASNGCRHLALTGTVFEAGEGAGSDGLPAITAYGLSKTLTAEVVSYRALVNGFVMGKFVIPNPFGPFEERKFTAYLFQEWARRRPAYIRAPHYVRDYVHVSLLAKAYVHWVEQFTKSGARHCSPSGYPESQEAFAERIAREVRQRSALTCGVVLAPESEMDEPRIRINMEPAERIADGWDEKAAWDAFISYYLGDRMGERNR